MWSTVGIEFNDQVVLPSRQFSHTYIRASETILRRGITLLREMQIMACLTLPWSRAYFSSLSTALLKLQPLHRLQINHKCAKKCDFFHSSFTLRMNSVQWTLRQLFAVMEITKFIASQNRLNSAILLSNRNRIEQETTNKFNEKVNGLERRLLLKVIFYEHYPIVQTILVRVTVFENSWKISYHITVCRCS